MFDMARMEEQCGDVACFLTILYLPGNIFSCLHLVIEDKLLNLTEVSYPMLLVSVNTFVSAPFTRFVLRLLQ